MKHAIIADAFSHCGKVIRRRRLLAQRLEIGEVEVGHGVFPWRRFVGLRRFLFGFRWNVMVLPHDIDSASNL
jgi:hypothetical protein